MEEPDPAPLPVEDAERPLQITQVDEVPKLLQLGMSHKG
jgi:hypothetical protein